MESSSFVETINIVSLQGNYLFSNGVLYENFDLTKRPWFNEKILHDNSGTNITDMHMDYSTGLDTIAIVSFIYSDDKELLGAAVMDIFIKDLLGYANTSFYSGDLNTYILKDNGTLYSINGEVNSNIKNTNELNIYDIKNEKDSLGNENYLLFMFNKDSIKKNPYMDVVTKKVSVILLIVGLFISIALVCSIPH